MMMLAGSGAQRGTSVGLDLAAALVGGNSRYVLLELLLIGKVATGEHFGEAESVKGAVGGTGEGRNQICEPSHLAREVAGID